MSTLKIRISSRLSKLAQLQSAEIIERIPQLQNCSLDYLSSIGDRDHTISLLNGDAPADFFTRDLDEQLLKNNTDLTVHSAKDLPFPLPEGLEVFCITNAFDKTDALVSRDNIILKDLPKGARLGTSSKNRKNQILCIRPDLKIVSIRGTIEERIDYIEQGKVDAVIVAACALLRLGLDEVIAEILPIRTHPLQGHLAVVGRKGELEKYSFLKEYDIRDSWGFCSLAGFGPGHPDLMTLRTWKYIKEADVILYDRLLDSSVLNNIDAECVYVGKESDRHVKTQDQINEFLFYYAVLGKRVIRLKGGDPFIYGRGGEELLYLRSRGVSVDVVPGISAAIAASALTETPLTHRGVSDSVAFLSAHDSNNLAIPKIDTLVIYMGAKNFGAVINKVINAGYSPDTPVAVLHRVSWPDQSITLYTLKDLSDSELALQVKPPVITIIGKTAALFLDKSQIESKKNILVTGSAYTIDCGKSSQVSVFHRPLIKLSETELSLSSIDIEKYNWLFFTSPNAVKFFESKLRKEKIDIRILTNIQIACIGTATGKALANSLFLQADLTSEIETSEGMAEAFLNTGQTNQNILHVVSEKSRLYLKETLEKSGHNVSRVILYTNTKPDIINLDDLDHFDEVHLKSPSAVKTLKEFCDRLPEIEKLVFKGPVTEKEWFYG